MGLETLFAMGGVLLLLGTLGVCSGARHKMRGTRGRLFDAEVVRIPAMPAREP